MDKKKEKEVERRQRKIDLEKQQTEEAINIRIFSLRSRWGNIFRKYLLHSFFSHQGIKRWFPRFNSLQARAEISAVRKIFTAKKFEFLGN